LAALMELADTVHSECQTDEIDSITEQGTRWNGIPYDRFTPP
jgi:hypothetical protein